MSNRLERGLRAAVRGSWVRDGPVSNATGEVLTLASPAGWPQGAPGEQGAMKLSAVNRCQVIISESVGKLPTYCVNEVTHERVNHQLLYLLNVRPNEAMTPSVEKQMVEANRLSGGNGYEWIIRDPRSGRPVELIPLPWELVTPWRDDRGLVWYGVTHPWTGEPMVLSNEDINHFKCYTHDGLHGISVLRRASEVIAAGRAAQQYEASYYANGGQPSGVLTTETDLGDKSVTRTDAGGNKVEIKMRDVIREEWERVHAGPTNAHRIAVLDYGLKYQPTSINNADAQFVESKAVTVEDIARFYGVPLSKLYAGKQAYNSNEQNAIDYVTSTLHPIINQNDEERSYKMLTDSELREGLRLATNMMGELKGDSAARATWYKTMREAGIFSVNDVRALEDMPDVEGGDERQASLNYVPLSDWKELSRKRAERGGRNRDESDT